MRIVLGGEFFDYAFDMYSDGDNDTNLDTAMKAIGRELGLI